MAVIKLVHHESAHWFPWMHGAERHTNCNALGCHNNEPHPSAGCAVYRNNRGQMIHGHLCEEAGRMWCKLNELTYRKEPHASTSVD